MQELLTLLAEAQNQGIDDPCILDVYHCAGPAAAALLDALRAGCPAACGERGPHFARYVLGRGEAEEIVGAAVEQLFPLAGLRGVPWIRLLPDVAQVVAVAVADGQARAAGVFHFLFGDLLAPSPYPADEPDGAPDDAPHA